MQVRDGNNVSGRSRKSTPFYQELDEILGHRAASQPAVLLSSAEGETTATLNCDEAENDTFEGFESIDDGTWQFYT